MRRKVLVPLAALAGVLLLPSSRWALAQFVPPPPPPPPVQPLVTPVLPPAPTVHLPAIVIRTPPGAEAVAAVEAARRRSATEAAGLLRKQNVVAISRAHRAALLSAITHDLLRQQQAVSLAELHRLRADWLAVGPGAGFDPVVAMQFEAAESAAERLVLAEVLDLLADKKFADARAKAEPLGAPRHLPVIVTQTLPELRDALRLAAALTQSQAALGSSSRQEAVAPLSAVAADRRPPAVRAAAEEWELLALVHGLLTGAIRELPLEAVQQALQRVEALHGTALARTFRLELAAQFFLTNRPGYATQLLKDGVDPVHAAAVLADLRAAVLGRGELITPQIAVLVPLTPVSPPAPARVILPPEQLAKWAPPAREPGTTTIDAALAAARAKFTTVVSAELTAATARVATATERVRTALAAESVPQKAFLEKVEAVRGKPFATPAERELALVAATRGLTAGEVAGVLAAAADRPAAAARLLAVAPAFVRVGELAVAVELSGRAPAGFVPHPDAGTKLAPGRDRSRLREAVRAALHERAGAVVSGREAPTEFERGAFEAGLHERLKLPPGEAPTAVECVQGLLDVCRDWHAEHTGLFDAFHDLNQTISDVERGLYGIHGAGFQEFATALKLRRLSVLADKKRREAGLVIGCRLLGAYAADAEPARDWLRAQSEASGTPWREAATDALGTAGKP